jgi:hypothetical protein
LSRNNAAQKILFSLGPTEYENVPALSIISPVRVFWGAKKFKQATITFYVDSKMDVIL